MPDSALVCDEVDPILLDVLKKNGVAASYEPGISADRILEIVGEYSAVVVRSRTTLTAEMVSRARNCKVIARVGVGLDNIDVAAAEARGIRVVNAAEGAVTAVAELVLGLMLCSARKIAFADRGVRDGRWPKKESKGTELSGKYLGIVGLGNIGRRLARLARGLNMNIIGYDPAQVDAEFAREVGLAKADLATLLQSSDYVSVHVPLTDSTRRMFDSARLSLMKPTAVLVNTSRGGVVDEDALYEALKDGRLGGAALDVFETEPAAGHKLAQLDNALLTPHVGAQTAEAQKLAANVAAEKIVQALRGVA